MSGDMSDGDRRREAARRGHHACPGCGGMYSCREVDGKDCGGHTRAKVSRRRPKNPLG